MPTISAGDLIKLRSENQTTQVFGTFAKPDTLWSAVITGTPSRGDTTITFNTGSGANFNLIQAEMEVWVGSTPGTDDIGRFRVKSITSGDGGVSGTLTVALNTLFFQAGDFLTFLLDFPFKPKYSKLSGTGTSPVFYKDTNITYTDENTNLYPIIIAGSNRSNFLTGGSWIVNPHLEDSYTLDGSTITAYSATSLSLDGTPTISIAAGTGIGTVTFTAVGQYWIRYSITSSNGQTQVSYRYYYVHSTDPTSEHYPHIDFEVTSVNGDWSKGGWSSGITVSDNASLADIPDKTIAILWSKNYYQDVEENITFLPDSSNVLISGYVQKEKITQDFTKGLGEVTFDIVTIEEIIRNHYGFSLSLEAKQSGVNEWFKFSATLTIPKALHHLWKWQSNLLEICDVFLEGNTTLRAFVEMEAGDLYTLADNIAYKAGIRYHVICDKSGRMHLTPDVQLLRDSERAVLNTIQTIETLDKSEKLVITRNPVNSTIQVKVSGFAWDGTFSTDCAQPLTSPCPAVEAICSSAPTINPSDEGAAILNFDQQTFEDQTHANEISGRYYAQANNIYPEIRITFAGNYAGVLDVVYPEFWQISIASTENKREIVWTNQNLICRNISLRIDQKKGIISPSVVFEPEVEGLPGVTTSCLGDYDFTFELPEFPDFEFPDLTTPGALITASDTNSVYYKGATGDAWTLRTSEDTLDLIQDPFWRFKNSSFEPRDSILLRCGVGFIKISNDTFVTDTDITPLTNPPNDAGDSPAPVVGDVEFFMMDGSWITEDYFVIGARWQNPSNEWRSWILITDDIGTTWTWESIITYTAGGGIGTSTQFLFGSGGKLVFTPNLLSAGAIGLVKLDSTNDYYAAVSRRQSLDNLRHGHLISRSGETLTENSDVGGPGCVNVFENSICRLSDTVFLTLNRDANLKVDRWLVSGTTVSHTGTLASSLSPDIPFYTKICGLTSTTAFGAWVNSSTGTIIKGAIITASGTTPTLGTVNTIYSGASAIKIHGMEKTATGEVILLFSEGSDVKSIILTSSPFSTGSVVTIEAGAGNGIIDGVTPIARITDTASPDVLLTYAQGSHKVQGCVINHTGTLINSVGTPTTIVSSTNISSIAVALNSETEGAVFYRVSSTGGIASFTISGTTITPISNSTGFGSLGEVSNGEHSLVWTEEDRYFIAAWSGNSLRGVATVVYPEVSGSGWTPSTETNNKLLGISIGKGNGLKLYATVWQPDEILVQSYDLGTFGLSNQLSVASATESQLNARSKIAFPYAIFGDDDQCVIFGNMTSGHILYTDDELSTISALVDDWGSDYCGAYFYDGNTVAAIRCDGTNSKIYTTNNYTLRSTIPFPDVEPHNLKADLFSGTIYILSGTAGSIMVIGSIPNYQTYGDITFNHTQLKGGNALEIL